MVFLAVRQFAVDEGRDERERGERLPVWRGIGYQEQPPYSLRALRRAVDAYL